MEISGIHLTHTPSLERPVLVAGFGGWGNALNVSKGLARFIAGQLNASPFGRLQPDAYYRYDEDRPWVKIQNGALERFVPPGGDLFAARTAADQRDLVVLAAEEPSLRWFDFARRLFTLSTQLGVDTIITLGSMYDNVLHWDRIVSGISSKRDFRHNLDQLNVVPINYHGPSAIHSIIQAEGPKAGFHCISLWGHCPYYLQEATHFGLMATLGGLIARICGFDLDTDSLEAQWREVEKQIHQLVENNADLQTAIEDLQKAKSRGSWEQVKGAARSGDKVIHLTDFLKPK